jgi:phosphatidylglycerol---prolipoprotein diacylglyceryl transferase
VIHLGPLPLRGYALMIILGIAVCAAIGDRRWVARGGARGTVGDLAIWAVPAGLIGARIYHVVTDPQLYFGHGRDWVRALEIWHGGLGIWGGIAAGAAAGAYYCRRKGISALDMADTLAPALAVAQAIGRWGNWFNQELYGRATSLPWGLRIDIAHRPDGSLGQGTYHPTFLYESLWDLGVAALVIWAERRFRLGRGRAFALYVAAYTVGRAWVEALRVDPVNHFAGLRLNDWVSLGVFVAALAYLVLRRDRPKVEV